MCGILGLIHRNPAQRAPLADAVLNRLAHRGPDGHGVYTDDAGFSLAIPGYPSSICLLRALSP